VEERVKSTALNDDFYESYGKEWATPLRESHERLCSAEKLEHWLEVIPEFVSIGSFIDYGCGNGVFLDLFAKHAGAKAIGVDVSQSMIDLARSKFPEHTYYKSSETDKAICPADAIFFNDILEHVPDPSDFIIEAKKHVRYICIRIPAEKTWLVAWLEALGLKEKKSRLFESEGHLHEFSVREVRQMIEGCGLKVVSMGVFNDSKKIVEHAYIADRMKKKGALRYALYRLQMALPYSILKALLRPLKGATVVAFCEAN